MIKLIVAVDSSYGIGYDNELLFRLKEDLKRFKEHTTGHFVVMGRKTYESLPKALPERTNVVITRDKKYVPKDKGVIVESNIEKIVSHYLNTGEQSKDLWVIGGAEIYKQFIPYVQEIEVTFIHKNAERADTYFPMEDVLKDFYLVSSERTFNEQIDGKVTYLSYRRLNS